MSIATEDELLGNIDEQMSRIKTGLKQKRANVSADIDGITDKVLQVAFNGDEIEAVNSAKDRLKSAVKNGTRLDVKDAYADLYDAVNGGEDRLANQH